jgi:dienelactone hydrolase
MIQSAVTFGPGDALVGVFTTPAAVRPGAPVVLLTNAGVLPRQGPHRMNVRLARALAEVGVPSLRMDLSGQGDSRALGTTASFRAQAIADLQSGMDWVEKSTGASRFFIFGICSSAVNAYDLSLADERIAGILMFDGFWYRSHWTKIVRHFKRAVAATWQERIEAIRRRIAPVNSRNESKVAARASAMMLNSTYLGNPSMSSFVDAMQLLVDRGTAVFIVYSGSIIDFYSYAGQFKHVFGACSFFSHIRTSYCPDIDHTFVTRHAQQRMIDLVRGWVVEQSDEQNITRR